MKIEEPVYINSKCKYFLTYGTKNNHEKDYQEWYLNTFWEIEKKTTILELISKRAGTNCINPQRN